MRWWIPVAGLDYYTSALVGDLNHRSLVPNELFQHLDAVSMWKQWTGWGLALLNG